MPFYRYFKFEDALKTLSGLCLRMSDPGNCNDPFEFNPVMDLSDITYDEATVYWSSDEGLKIIYEKERIAEPFNQFKQSFSRDALKGVVDKWFFRRPQIAEEMSFQKSCREFQIICGSRTPASILMWAHYAEKHSGVVIEFDLDQFPFSIIQKTGRLTDVNYKNERPVYKHRFDPSYDFLEEFNRVVKTKYTRWDYEEEVRIVLPVGDHVLKTRVIKRLDGHYYLSVTPSSITSIIMGSRITEAHVEILKEVLNQEVFCKTKLKKASLSKCKFEMEIE